MQARWIQLPFQPELGGFDDEPLTRALAGRSAAAVREYFFAHEGRPYLGCFVEWDEEEGRFLPLRARPEQRSPRPEASPALDELARRAVAALKHWRSARARELGVPAYRVLTNRQVESLAVARPESLAALGALEGIGAATLEAHGETLLALLRDSAHPQPREALRPESGLR